MSTITDLVYRTGTRVLEHLDAQATVPLLDGQPGFQGDVSIRPTSAAAITPMPLRVDVVRGEAGGNTHSLHPDGPGVTWDAHAPSGEVDLRLGVVTVPDGSEAVLAHPEHGFLRLAPGSWEIGRQRDYAGEWAYVAD